MNYGPKKFGVPTIKIAVTPDVNVIKMVKKPSIHCCHQQLSEESFKLIRTSMKDGRQKYTNLTQRQFLMMETSVLCDIQPVE